jgi:hypothetical protein
MIAHHVVRTRNVHPGFLSESVAGKIGLATEQMVKGEDPRKYVFVYTSDTKDTPEFRAYKSFLESVRNSK